MKTLYCDASFSPQGNSRNGENIVRGKIAVVGEGIEKVDKVAIGKVEGLQQYNNVLELTAIARAIELATDAKNGVKCDHPEMCNHWACHPHESLAIFTDSKTAMYWASAGKIKSKGIETLAHTNALDYLRKMRLAFGGVITFNFTRREGNPAGKLLEDELEKERSYAI